MKKTIVQELNEFGQSVWLDNISRSMFKTGKLQKMIGLGLRGMTSNPTIFEKAISASSDYDEEIFGLQEAGKSTFGVYDELTVRDVQDAADLFLGVYRDTGGRDGYVSLEINPKLAHDAEETIREGVRLYKKVARPNLMLKVPATEAGFKAIEELTAFGANINATLIFSLMQYIDTAQAYLRGIERFRKSKEDISKVHSVASVFVNRIDTYIDNLLGRESVSLKGRAAVSNCALIYKKWQEIFSDAPGNAQRVLWASTSTKNPEYSDIKYVTEIVAKNTVNTMPEQTLAAFLDHGTAAAASSLDPGAAQKTVDTLKARGIDIADVCRKLLQDGLSAFEKSFDALLNSLEQKRAVLQ